MTLRAVLTAIIITLGATAPAPAVDPDQLPMPDTPAGMVVSIEYNLILSKRVFYGGMLSLQGYARRALDTDWVREERASFVPHDGRSWPENDYVVQFGLDATQANHAPRLLFIPLDFIPDVDLPDGGYKTAWFYGDHPHRELRRIPLNSYLKLCEPGEALPVEVASNVGPVPGIHFWRPVTGFVLIKHCPWPQSDATATSDLNIQFQLEFSANKLVRCETMLKIVSQGGYELKDALETYDFYSPELAGAALGLAPDLIPGGGIFATSLRGGLIAGNAWLASYRIQNAKTDAEKLGGYLDLACTAFSFAGAVRSGRTKLNGAAPRSSPEHEISLALHNAPVRSPMRLSGPYTKEVGLASLNIGGVVYNLPAQELAKRQQSLNVFAYLSSELTAMQSSADAATRDLAAKIMRSPRTQQLLADAQGLQNRIAWDALDPKTSGSYYHGLDLIVVNEDAPLLQVFAVLGHEVQGHRTNAVTNIANTFPISTKGPSGSLLPSADITRQLHSALADDEIRACDAGSLIVEDLERQGVKFLLPDGTDMVKMEHQFLQIKARAGSNPGAQIWQDLRMGVMQLYKTRYDDIATKVFAKASVGKIDLAAMDGACLADFLRAASKP